MHISDLCQSGDRFSATFRSERRDAGDAFTGFIQGPTISPDGTAFLLAAWLPAWMAGERRIKVDGAVCPLVIANLTVVASVLRGWFDDFPTVPTIECDTELRKSSGERGGFLSGGVDSLSMISDLAPELDVAVIVDYQDIAGVDPAETEARFQSRVEICRRVCDAKGLELWPVRTNLRRLNTSMDFWIKRYHGCFLAAIAHGLDLHEISIASTYDAPHLDRWGSHPLLDPNFSSRRLQVRHYGLHQSRLDKVRSLGDWPLALDSMYVCTARRSGGSNCGECEKCIRTRLELLALGLDSKAFPLGDVTAQDLDKLKRMSGYAWSCYHDTIPLLRERGRSDLADAVERKAPRRPSILNRWRMLRSLLPTKSNYT